VADATAAITPLDDFGEWIRGDGLEIVLFVLGAILLVRFVGWLRDLLLARIGGQHEDSDAVVRSEETKHRRAVAQILMWVATVVIWTVTLALVLNRFGIPYASLVAPLAAGGVALGLGAQRLVQDLINGSFIIAERQYGFGDLIQIASTPETDGAMGTVEDLTLRITRLRTPAGERVVIPNGQIVQVTNLSSEWARAIVDVPVPLGTDIAVASSLLREVGVEAYADEELKPLLLNPPTPMGVESFEGGQLTLRMVARTQPGKQFEVARALRVRVAERFLRERITTTPVDAAAPPSKERGD
jgi:small conductance mechanosensitive channel